jgi:hypothetical protein
MIEPNGRRSFCKSTAGIRYNKFSPCRELIVPSQPSYQVTNISLKTGFKNIRRTPTRDKNSPLETQEEGTNQDANLAADFAVLTTTLNKLSPIHMPSSTKDEIVRKATSLQNRANDIRQQQLQQQVITEKIILENSRNKRGNVLDLQELEAVCWSTYGNSSDYE